MAEEIVLNIKVTNDDGEQKIGSLKQQLKEATLETQRLTQQFGATSKQAIEAAKRASELKDEIGDIGATIDALNPDEKFKAFAGTLQGVVGGFTALQGAMALFGDDGKAVEETMKKLQGALALSQGIDQVVQLKDGFKNLGIVLQQTSLYQKAAGVATAAYNMIVGASTGAMKLFRLALVSTGIGALVVGLGLLIANFGKVKQFVIENSDKLMAFGKIVLNVVMPFTLLGRGLDFLASKFKFVGDAMDWVKEKFAWIVDGVTEVLQALNVIDSAEENAAEDKAERVEKEKKDRERMIELMRAEGKSAKEIRDAELKMLAERAKAYEDLLKARQKAGDELDEEETEKLKESQFEYKKALLEDARLTKEENDKALKEEQDKQKKLQEERDKAEKDRQKKNEDARKERERKAEEERKRLLELEKQLQDERIKAIVDDRAREIAQVNLDFERKLATLTGQSEVEKNLRIQLETNKQNAINEINRKFEEENAAKEAEKIQKNFEDRTAKLNADLINMQLDNQVTFDKERELEENNYLQKKSQKDLTNGQLELIEAEHKQRLNDIAKKEGDANLKVEQDIRNAKISIAENTIKGLSALGDLFIKDAKKREKFQKALAVTQLAIDTAKAISTTIASATAAAAAGGPAAPFLVAGYIASGIASVLGAFASAKSILGSTGETPAPTPTPSGGGGSPTSDTGNFLSAQTPTVNNPQASTLIRASGGNEDKDLTVKAYVVETEMTQTQKRVSSIETQNQF